MLKKILFLFLFILSLSSIYSVSHVDEVVVAVTYETANYDYSDINIFPAYLFSVLLLVSVILLYYYIHGIDIKVEKKLLLLGPSTDENSYNNNSDRYTDNREKSTHHPKHIFNKKYWAEKRKNQSSYTNEQDKYNFDNSEHNNYENIKSNNSTDMKVEKNLGSRRD
ncbi:MAG: hypothetical protein HRU03_08115 [Nanoarchaeales archaeon]|nr:hypothetical protein [Nanoarchaeales archaeon]